MADHAKVDQRQPPVVSNEDVAGMRICVEEPVDESLMQICLYQLVGKTCGISIQKCDRVQRGYLRATHVFHRQDAFADVSLDWRRHEDALVLSKILFQRVEMVRLDRIVELFHERLAELLDHRGEFIPPATFCVVIDEYGDLVEHLQIAEYLVENIGPLYLDGNRPSVAECRAMHLPERRRSEWV